MEMKDEMGQACISYERDVKYMQNCSRETWMEEAVWNTQA